MSEHRRAANREAQRRWREKNPGASGRHYHKKSAAVQAIKLDRGCVDCGYREHAVALDFDHLDAATKKFSVSTGVRSHSIAALLAEIEKCEVVCANCHRVRTAKRHD